MMLPVRWTITRHRKGRGLLADFDPPQTFALRDDEISTPSRLPGNGRTRPSVSAAANNSSRSSTRSRPARLNAAS